MKEERLKKRIIDKKGERRINLDFNECEFGLLLVRVEEITVNTGAA